MYVVVYFFVFFFKQKTAYEMRISDWSSDVCSSDLFEMTEVEGRIEAIIRASPQLVEIEKVPLPFIVMGADNEHTGAGPYPHDIIDKTSGCGLQRLGEGVDRFLYRYKWGEIGRASCRERVCQYV